MLKRPDRNKVRQKKHWRLRHRISGSIEKPRLCVFRSLNHIYAQVIDDRAGQTLVAVSSLDPEVRQRLSTGGNVAAAQEVGRLLAQKSLVRGVRRVVFDRGGYLYHGRVAALAAGAREGGLEF